MKFENGAIKPCSTCYKARQAAKDAMALIGGKQLPKAIRVLTTAGGFTIDKKTNTITEVLEDTLSPYVGVKVYLAGRNVIDVAKAAPIPELGQVQRSFPIDADITPG